MADPFPLIQSYNFDSPLLTRKELERGMKRLRKLSGKRVVLSPRKERK